ncbi:hypothetical protein B0A54_01931 [Friedmanniomyces endolithicus]|uniref:Apple domain-containing protein n=1 Tax=Friedmanniomyces endolithicus TaxID=329885 RepID=A0A4V5NBY0_9PEZI|nr:hypothetical protein B0A54_01931 [Friedmanniomyces endolithicus]
MARSTSSMASYYALLLSAAGLASSAALASTALSCPASNGTTVSNSTAGTTYTIECGIDRYDNDLGLVYKPTLETCIDACNDHPKCVDVSWIPGNPGPCYLKQGVGAVEYKSEIWGARMTQTTRVEEINWPASNGTQYKDPNVSGRVYEIECDTDHFDTDYSTNPIYVAHLEECIAACDKTTGCQVGVLYGAACYLKHGVNPAIHMPGALGARCISGCQAVLSSSSTDFGCDDDLDHHAAVDDDQDHNRSSDLDLDFGQGLLGCQHYFDFGQSLLDCQHDFDISQALDFSNDSDYGHDLDHGCDSVGFQANEHCQQIVGDCLLE